MYIIIYSEKNYLFELLCHETKYKVKHFKNSNELQLEINSSLSQLIIIDHHYNIAQTLYNQYSQLKIILIVQDKNLITIDLPNIVIIKKPIDLNKLLDIINDYYHTSIHNQAIVLNQDFILLKNNKTLINKANDHMIHLTSKELAIIEYLYNNPSTHVNKMLLLKSIWNYNDNLDTHTLETHIYRLRQKLDQYSDLIITHEDGYSLKN